MIKKELSLQELRENTTGMVSELVNSSLAYLEIKVLAHLANERGGKNKIRGCGKEIESRSAGDHLVMVWN